MRLVSAKGKLDFETLRSLTLKALKDRIQTDHVYVTDIIDAVDKQAVDLGLLKDVHPYSTGMHSFPMYMPLEDREKIRIMIWQLILQGIVVPGGYEHEPNFASLKITEYGKEVLETGEMLAYDPDGFMKGLRSSVPRIDDVILTYVEEALRSFMSGCYFASTVMLGVASEQGILLLIEQYENSIQDNARRSQFESDVEQARSIMRKFETFRKEIEPRKKELRQNVCDDLDIQLDGIFNYIRINRNDAGHPTGRKMTRQEALSLITVFPNYIRTLYKLIDYFQPSP